MCKTRFCMEPYKAINFMLKEQLVIKIGVANKPTRCRNFQKSIQLLNSYTNKFKILKPETLSLASR